MGMEKEYNPNFDIYNFFKTQQDMIEYVQGKQVITKDLETKSGRIFLVPLYDVHLGSKTCLTDLFTRTLKYILETPDCYTFLGGDAMESATRQSIGLGMIDEEFHLTTQSEILQEFLTPLVKAGKVIGAITGNHEMRPMYFNGDNAIYELARDLGIPYLGFQGYIILNVNGIQYKVFVHHGAGASRSKGAKVNAAVRPNNIAIADCYITGHLHDRFAIPDVIFDIEDGEIVQKQRWYIAAGSFLQYFGGYPEMQMLAPSLPGAMLVEFSGIEKSIHAHI
jgi:hypothetical protein